MRDVRKNACELEIDLFCRGMRLDDGGGPAASRASARTRAGLGSGVELVLTGGHKELWANVPVLEPFVAGTPYRLIREEAGHFIEDERDGARHPVRLVGQPRWYARRTSRGTPMGRVGVMQGTYLAVYIGEVCDFWTMDPPARCLFCTTGLNVGAAEEAVKDVGDVVETARAAKDENGITFVHFNSGFHRDAGVELAEPYVRAIKRDVGAMVGVQLAPDKDLAKYDRLIDLGVEHFSFCYELNDPAAFARCLPGKQAHLGQKAFFDALEHTSRRLGKGRVSGELIAGIEPIAETKKAIDYITGAGAFPTICIFRPLAGADMAADAPPQYEDMRELFAYAIESLRKNDIPIGLAPNLEVSLVVLATDAMELAPDTWAFRAWRLKLAAMKALAYPYFRYRMRRHDPGR